MKTTFAKNMEARRKQLGWTRRQAENAIGISFRNIQAYEEGRATPDCLTLVKIAEAYNIADLASFIKSPLTKTHLAGTSLDKKQQVFNGYCLLTGDSKKAVDILLGLKK